MARTIVAMAGRALFEVQRSPALAAGRRRQLTGPRKVVGVDVIKTSLGIERLAAVLGSAVSGHVIEAFGHIVIGGSLALALLALLLFRDLTLLNSPFRVQNKLHRFGCNILFQEGKLPVFGVACAGCADGFIGGQRLT